jgi:hypothetical protein
LTVKRPVRVARVFNPTRRHSTLGYVSRCRLKKVEMLKAVSSESAAGRNSLHCSVRPARDPRAHTRTICCRADSAEPASTESGRFISTLAHEARTLVVELPALA